MGRVTTRVRRQGWNVATGVVVERTDTVAVEEPLEIRVGADTVTTTMRTPGDDFDLTIGHLLTEGLLHSADEVGTLMHCTDVGEDGVATFNVVDVTLGAGVHLHRPVRERAEPMTSACGVCGVASIAAVSGTIRYAVAHDPVLVPPDVVAEMPEALGHHQPVFDRTGGVHAAGLFTADGTVLAVREDVGRHNAVDKALGAVARDRGLPFAGTVLTVSSRASFEIIQKAAVTGIPVVVAIGAPTSLAVELATDAGITLAAFTRNGRFSLYARPDRVAAAG